MAGAWAVEDDDVDEEFADDYADDLAQTGQIAEEVFSKIKVDTASGVLVAVAVAVAEHIFVYPRPQMPPQSNFRWLTTALLRKH